MPAVMREGESRVTGKADRRGKEIYDGSREKEGFETPNRSGRLGRGDRFGFDPGRGGPERAAQFPQFT